MTQMNGLVSGTYSYIFEFSSDYMKRSIVIAGHKTSISIEEPFWKSLREIAAAKGFKVSDLVAIIDNGRQQGNLSSHIRLFVLEYYQARTATLNAAEQSASSATVATSG